MAVVEEVCSRLPSKEADELKAEISETLRKNCPLPKPNIIFEEFKTIKELREDRSRDILMANIGVAKVVMDRQDYLNGGHHLLDDRETYRSITTDPTSRLKNKLMLALRNIKITGGFNDFQYKRLYPTSEDLSKFYGLPKINHVGTPLGPLFSVWKQSPSVLPRSWPTSSDPWWASPLTTLKIPNSL